MMITPDCVRDLARYNTWQNTQLQTILRGLDPEVVIQERGAFFGSILGTANHILWADQVWMSRLAKGDCPAQQIGESGLLTSNLNDWEIARFRTDSAITRWASNLRAVDLTGDLRWRSLAENKNMETSKALCVMHMFNHQTHHRGQLHVMLTSVGCQGPVSDLIYMPQDA